jgi:flagellar biosynthesis activator protein FlaF
MTVQAYQRAATQAENPREIEYRVFGLVTAALIRVRDNGRADIAALSKALHDNRRLWSTLLTDCARPENRLPPETRAQIISLAMFVDRYSSSVMREGADLEALIDINRSIMDGLVPKATP